MTQTIALRCGGKSYARGFWSPPRYALARPRKCFSCLVQFRQCILGLNQPVRPVPPASNLLFSGRGGWPQPAVCDVLKACLTQASSLAALKKEHKPPIGGVCDLTMVMRYVYARIPMGMGIRFSTAANISREREKWLAQASFLASKKIFPSKFLSPLSCSRLETQSP